MYCFDCCPLRTFSRSCSSKYLTASNCSSPASEMVWTSSVMVAMLTSMVSVSVRPASCRCVERSFKALMSLSCAEGSTCFWSSSNCSFGNFSTTVGRCLRDFGPVASCGGPLFQSMFSNHELPGRLLLVNPANLLWRRELLSLFTSVPVECVPETATIHHVALKTNHHTSYSVMSRDKKWPTPIATGAIPFLSITRLVVTISNVFTSRNFCALCLDPACSFGLNLLALHGLDLGGFSWFPLWLCV